MDWLDNIGSWLSDHNPAELVSAGIGKLVSGIFSIIASLVNDAVASVVKDVATIWMKVPSPDLSGGGEKAVAPSDMSGLTTIMSWVKWVGFAVAGIALVIILVRFAVLSGRGETMRFTSRIMLVLFGTVFIGAAAGIVGAVVGPGPVNGGGTAAKIQSHLWVYMLVLATVSVIVGVVKMMWQADARPGQDTLKSILTLVVVAGAGTPFIQLCITMGDSFSDWILGEAADGDFGKTMVGTMVFSATIPGGPILVLIVGVLCMLAAVFQVIVMICRAGMLVVLTGMLPLAASAVNTESGRNWANKNIGWLAAFLLYKPVASIIYATCFWMVGGGAFGGAESGSLVNVLVGFSFMLMCLVALPALMKACVPAVSALTSGGGGGGALAAAAPTGAMLLASGSSGGGGGASGSGAPSGSSSAAGSGGASAGGASAGGAAAGAASGGIGLAVAAGAKAVEKGKQAMDEGIGDAGSGSSAPDGAKPVSGPSSGGASGSQGSQGFQAGSGPSGPSGSSQPPDDASGGGYGQGGQSPSGMAG